MLFVEVFRHTQTEKVNCDLERLSTQAVQTIKTFNPSLRHHALIGILLSVWGFLFAFFIRPFEHGEMDTEKWLLVSIGFSGFVFVAYLIVSILQKGVYKRRGAWSLFLEIGFYVVFYLIYTMLTYVFYRSSIIQGFYGFGEFLQQIILKIFLVVTPILFIARRYVHTLISKNDDVITLKGANKLDVLKIKPADLVCISNAQNYAEVYYLENDVLKTKLLRSSLKQMEADIDFMIRIHRSHLINPSHFKSWVDGKTVALTQLQLPVAKNYKERLLSL